MSSGMPELGSKISLISKADIRYEGRLFTVDPQECTIALASVRSFGTEDRETQFPVAPQNQVYDYILFRGSDIKDIRVVNNVPSMPNDPAIMQLSVPASLGGGVGPQYAAPQYAHPVVGSAQYPPYHPMTAMQPSMRPMKQPSELAHHQEMAPAPVQQLPTHAAQVKDQASMLDLIGGGNNAQPQNHSRSATPSASVPHRKSPTADQGTQVGSGQGGQRDSRRSSNNAQRYNQQHGQQHTQQHAQQHSQQGQQQGQQHSQQQNQNQQRNRPNSHNRNQNHQQQHQGGQREQGQQAQQQGQQALQQGQHQNNQQQHGQQHYGQQGQHPMQHQGYDGGWRGRGGGGGGGGGAWRGRGGGRGGRGGFPQSRNKLKFDNDYDFEQANTEFEELRSQLAKVKIGEEVKPEPVPVLNQTLEKKEDSGNETGAGEPEPEDDRDDFTPYDKAKSFFDNISCEAVERQKGRSQRTDWRTERKLNSETFGVASARRGAWRGRGGWRQYPQHQPWRAGGRGGRGRGGGNMLLPNSTGIPNNSRQPRQQPVGAPAPATAPLAQPTAAK